MIDAYLKALRRTPLDDHTEMTGRAALEGLLNATIAANGPKGAIVTHEAKHLKGNAPDFKISLHGQIIAYVETKAVDANFRDPATIKQVDRYRSLCPNVLLTDYLRFDLFGDDQETVTVRLGESALLTGKPVAPQPERTAELMSLLARLLTHAPQGLGRARDLAQALAIRAHMLRDYLAETLTAQAVAGSGDRLTGLYLAFKAQVSRDLTLQEFADAYAQTLAYGLFLAKLNAETTIVTLTNAKGFIPAAVPLLRELVGFLDSLDDPTYADIRWVVDEVLSIVNGLKLSAIVNDLSFRNRKPGARDAKAYSEAEWRLFSKDPFIYFYEDFLKAYDAATRKGRGVYYTPPPVVSFIVRAVHDVLKDTFGIATGLADRDRVTVLDFACGTGTFLVEIMEQIFNETGGTAGGKAQKIVDEHLLKNLYGFEFLVAPYTIAHLKLSQYLRDAQLCIPDGSRFQVYLTNTVEPMAVQGNFLLPALSKETEAAQSIKEKPILVITGNPPYSGHSRNNGPVAVKSVAAYRDGFPELSKPGQGKWLQDDYVKFVRFAQMKVDDAGEGIVAIITNHSFLDNPTFRGMRQSLMRSFDQIYVVDLHGNSKKKEVGPNGEKDENVFDIEQGVAISLLVKKKGIERGVWHTSLWGLRQEKYEWAARMALRTTAWSKISPMSPNMPFVPRDDESGERYEKLWSVADIFSPIGNPAPGFATQHDDFAISFSKREAIGKVKTFLAASNESDARLKFSLCAQNQWLFSRARKELPALNIPQLATEVQYRPFDNRWTIWDRNVAVHRRVRLTSHLLRPNIGIIIPKNASAIGVNGSNDYFICSRPVELNFYRRGGEFIFPLYLYPPPSNATPAKRDLFGTGIDPFAGKARIENIAPKFRTWLDKLLGVVHSPETLLAYTYAVLHAPTYRRVYAEFLRAGFPRIPFPDDNANFVELAILGEGLIAAHLLDDVPKRGLGSYTGKGDDTVTMADWRPDDCSIVINATQTFADVPQKVWEFTIGGYPVLHHYLKARKDRVLTLDEIENVEKVVNVLAFTIDRMIEIDVAYATAFPTTAVAA